MVWVCAALAWLVLVLMIVLVRRRVGSVAIGWLRTRRRGVAGRGRRRGESYVWVWRDGRTSLRRHVLIVVHSLLLLWWC